RHRSWGACLVAAGPVRDARAVPARQRQRPGPQRLEQRAQRSSNADGCTTTMLSMLDGAACNGISPIRSSARSSLVGASGSTRACSPRAVLFLQVGIEVVALGQAARVVDDPVPDAPVEHLPLHRVAVAWGRGVWRFVDG